VLSIALVVGVLTGILFGLVPTWHSSLQDPAVVLQQGSRSLTGEAGKMGKALIITQVALSLVLLLGAGLLVGTFQRLRSLNLGFDKGSLLEIIPNATPGGHQNLNFNSYHQRTARSRWFLAGFPESRNHRCCRGRPDFGAARSCSIGDLPFLSSGSPVEPIR
jgi:hypothetical protein